MKVTSIGEGGIVAQIVADSVSEERKRITTFKLTYPRFIHSELMTHRMFSRNAASSRAIPVATMIDQVRERPAMPIHWGKNQAGMQAKEELDKNKQHKVSIRWYEAAMVAADLAQEMSELGAHKQIVNRILEPFQFMTTILTATEFENFFWLRQHADAQPEIKELADMMFEAVEDSVPVLLKTGEWHTPFFENGYWKNESKHAFSLEHALKISASCCAQVSFRKEDNSLEKALAIYERLVDSSPVHASPFEHAATPMEKNAWLIEEKGPTHLDSKFKVWSNNFQGWIQYRSLIPNNVKM